MQMISSISEASAAQSAKSSNSVTCTPKAVPHRRLALQAVKLGIGMERIDEQRERDRSGKSPSTCLPTDQAMPILGQIPLPDDRLPAPGEARIDLEIGFARHALGRLTEQMQQRHHRAVQISLEWRPRDFSNAHSDALELGRHREHRFGAERAQQRHIAQHHQRVAEALLVHQQQTFPGESATIPARDRLGFRDAQERLAEFQPAFVLL